MLDDNGMPNVNASKTCLSEEQRLMIVSKKTRKAKVSIAMGALCCLAFLVVLICGILTIIDVPIDFETIFFFMCIFIFIASIIGVVCGTKAKAKVNREQLLEGKSLRYVRAGVIMSYFSLGLCILCVILYITISCLIFFTLFFDVVLGFISLIEAFIS